MKPTIREIISATAQEFKVPEAYLLERARKRVHARPRQVAMFLCREMGGFSLTRIGKAIGHRDHTTVLHGYRAVLGLIRDDAFLAKVIAAASLATALARLRAAQERESATSLHADIAEAEILAMPRLRIPERRTQKPLVGARWTLALHDRGAA